ncbi:KTSC domain-containing protein [Paenibacillus turpanensis]|uniref:KTSC domain-containing protein n=1 Tax=Paenibacillus turpanensis TaxID=2689078 RepID=UPI00140DB603|nr:KTSC domain-containing protein [Paenibacillus turpanensis]
MEMIPIGSKQIACVSYDAETSSVIVHYHTGEASVCPSVPENQFRKLAESDNKYDFLMEIIRTKPVKA